MAKTANVYVRIDPELKERAERILSLLGISPSALITLLYKQVILHRGIPFEVKLPYARPVDISSLTKDELIAELDKGLRSIKSGATQPADEVFKSLSLEFGEWDSTIGTDAQPL
ncbi:type II toxin-antitoxin system RelB/DinJ family antitoxin [Actinotignum sp. GS-2025a]|uniref:type II toxin-antitoxin system RelB/DinJ family antitoxin n=1 Tax=Actinotignum sp. GS-2025a TaxID=3427274 RepID=UPI003F47D10F